MPNNQLQFSPESDEYLGVIPPEISKIIIYLILLIVISGVIYMYFGRINNISSSQFILIPMGGVKKVQSFHYGKIVKILVDVNDQVKKDAVLFEIKSNEVILELSEIEKYNNALKRLADDLKLKTEYYDGEKEIKRMMIKQYEKEDNLSRRLRKSEINRLRKLLSNYQNDLEMLQMELKIRKTQYLKNKNLYSQKEILENDFNNSELSYKKVKNEVRKITREIAQLSKEISLKEEEALKISTLLTEKIVTNKKEIWRRRG